MTNAEWVRSMTDKELTIWLCTISTCTYCDFIEYCDMEGTGTRKWLKQEHEENSDERGVSND